MLSPTYTFERMGYKSKSFMLNMADLFTMVCAISFIIPIVSVIKLMLPTNNFTSKADNFIRGRFLILLVNLTLLKTVFLASLNFVDFSLSNSSSGFNSFASIVGMIYCLIVPLYYIFQLFAYHREVKAFNKLKESEIDSEEGLIKKN
jgi:hypothetical protein